MVCLSHMQRFHTEMAWAGCLTKLPIITNLSAAYLNRLIDLCVAPAAIDERSDHQSMSLNLSLETRDKAHIQETFGSLRRKGYVVEEQ